MSGFRLPSSIVFGAIVGSLLFQGTPAWASNFQVSPVRLPLTAAASSGLLTVRNKSSEPLRFQVTGFAWSQGSDGEMRLSPTKDIVFFPTMISLKPGDSRNLRVGAQVPFGSTEKTYRIFVEELPPIDGAGVPNGVKVLMRMGIPVFLEPANAVATPQIDALKIQGQRLAFALRDLGTKHFFTKRIHVALLGEGDKALFEQDLPAWYMLGGGVRNYGLDLPANVCGATRIQVRVETDKDAVESFLAAPSSACPR
jgi:fimbrial chaperone protein